MDTVNEKIPAQATVALSEAAGISFLTPENCRFERRGDFTGAKLSSGGEAKDCDRVWFRRSFPYKLPWEYISVQDCDGEEIGLIRRVDDFPPEQREIIGYELDRKYYTPRITKIHSLKEMHGTSFWKCNTDAGELEFTLQDTSRSISVIDGDKAVIVDANGNRYEISPISALDKKSMRKLEIYL